MKVVKRNGRTVPFDFAKIEAAVNGAYGEVRHEAAPASLLESLRSTMLYPGDGKTYGVEEIQNIVELHLFREGLFDVGVAYRDYRKKHEEMRDFLNDRIAFIRRYSRGSENAASSSNTDPNANVSVKNVSNCYSELYKDENRKLMRYQLTKKLEELYPEVARQYVRDIEHHIIYPHDEATSGVPMPYCMAVSLFPFMQHGTSPLDGTHAGPATHLSSFSGQFKNLVFLLSSQVKGAVAFGGFFLVFAWYCRKDFGERWWLRGDELASLLPRQTIRENIEQYFQAIVHTINQPASNRGYQSPFTNISYYDREYFNALFGEFRYPDETAPLWEEVDYLQRLFMNWFNRERTRTLLTFPVETMALLTDKDGAFRDPDYKKLTAEMYAKGHSFFTYISDNPNALASCCRLRNEIKENTFSFSTGLTGVQTGSVNVITLNHARIVQDWANANGHTRAFLASHFFEVADSYRAYLCDILERVYKYHIAYKTLVYEMEKLGMLTACNEKYIAVRKLYSTIGDNGINEAAEFLGMKCSYNEDYKRFCRLVVGTVSEMNRSHSTKEFLFNQEFVPAEGLSSKNLRWDKADGYWVPEGRILYNSYFYLADDKGTGIGDKFRLHGREFTELLDGGVGLHCNLQEHLTEAQYLRLLDYAVECGTSYFTFNVPNSECTNGKCHHIVKLPMDTCPKCGAPMRQYTRVIGYLRPIEGFDKERRKEAHTRHYAAPGALPPEIGDGACSH